MSEDWEGQVHHLVIQPLVDAARMLDALRTYPGPQHPEGQGE